MMRSRILIGCVLVMGSVGAWAIEPETRDSTPKTPPPAGPVLLPPPTAESVKIKKLTDALAKAKASAKASDEKVETLTQTIRELEGKLQLQEDAMALLREKITAEVQATLRGEMAVLQKEIEQKSKVVSLEPAAATPPSTKVETPDACPAEWEPSFAVVREYILARRPVLEKQIQEHIEAWNNTEDAAKQKEIKAALDADKEELKTIKRRNLPPLPPLHFDTVQVGRVGPIAGGEVIVDQVIGPTMVRVRQGKSFGRSQAVFLQGVDTSKMVQGKPYKLSESLFFVSGVRHYKTQTDVRLTEHVIEPVDRTEWLTAYKQWLKTNPKRPSK